MLGEGELPTGEPKELDSPTRDGQVPADLLRARDARVGVSAEERKRARGELESR